MLKILNPTVKQAINRHAELFRKYGWQLLNVLAGPGSSVLEFWSSGRGVAVCQVWPQDGVTVYFEDATNSWAQLEQNLKDRSQKIITTVKGTPFEKKVFKDAIVDEFITYRVAGLSWEDFECGLSLDDSLVDEIVESGIYLQNTQYKFVGTANVDGTITVEVSADASVWLGQIAEETNT